MKKILKIKVKREPLEKGGTHYVYPPEYDSGKISVLCYESFGDAAAVMARGKYNYEYCIGVVDSKDAPAFLKSPDIEELTKEEAIPLGDKWLPQTERILDQQKVLLILAKNARGAELTQNDLNALDPDHPESGIGKGKSFSERLTENL